MHRLIHTDSRILVAIRRAALVAAQVYWLFLVTAIAQAGPGPADSRAAIATSVQQGRTHPAYQVFAYKLVLPPIATESNGTLIVGRTARWRLGGTNEIDDLRAVAMQFDVPVPVVAGLLTGLNANAKTNIDEAAQELRTAVTDYKYLLWKWSAYRPGVGKEKSKQVALELLAAGKIEPAWMMYNALLKPPPPEAVQVQSPAQPAGRP